jgi:hypothetical protein
VGTTSRRFVIEECPYCLVPHTMTVEVAFRQQSGALPAREVTRVCSVCKYTGGGFTAAIEIEVPAGQKFGRIQPISFANG